MPIHPTAIVDKSARIGTNVSIGPYAVIGPEVAIGDECVIWPHTVIEYTTLGKACQVFPNASLGLAPQHLKYKGEKTKLTVGDRTIFREGVTVHRGTALDKSETIVGNDCYLMALSHVAHDCRVGNNVIMANGAQLAGHVQIGESCFISATVGIHQYVRIGKGALVSGGAMVPLDVAPFCIAQGDRADIRGLNVVGMRRLGIDRESIALLKEAFKIMFHSGLTLKEALDAPALNVANAHVQTFREFLLEPKRGFLRPEGKLGKYREAIA
jgi:UDP-N-acetylglucosamine acyltransferase